MLSLHLTHHYYQVYREKGYENMVVFEEELENYFDNFTDLAQSFPLFHGKRHEDEDLDEDKAVGYFKVGDRERLFHLI